MTYFVISADARRGVWQRDRHHTTDVLAALTVPDQVARPEGLPDAAPDTQGAEAAHAGLLSDHVVAQPRHRHS